MKHWRIIWAFPNPRCPCLEDCKLNTDSCMPCNYIQLWRYIFMLKYSRLSGIFPGLPGAAQSPVTRVTGVIEYLGWRISQMITPLHSKSQQIREARPAIREDICPVTYSAIACVLSTFAPGQDCFCRRVQKLITCLCHQALLWNVNCVLQALQTCCSVDTAVMSVTAPRHIPDTLTAGLLAQNSDYPGLRESGNVAEGSNVFKVSASPPKCNDRIVFCS